MDTGTQGELIAASLSVGEIESFLNVDSLAYLELDRVKTATGAHGAGFCDACFTGSYPVEVPVNLSKGVLDVDRGAAPAEPVVEAMGLLFEHENLLPADHAKRIDQDKQA
jgi:amidophosphoribosyltransferase